MSLAFVNGEILTPDGFVTGRALLVDGLYIEDVVPAGDARVSRAQCVDLEGHLLLPGFIDTQVNGGGGVLFNDSPAVKGVRTIGAAHSRFGTTGFLPTLISDDLETLASAIRAIDEAIAVGVPGVLGIHIEGPFVSMARRGVHDASHIREPDVDFLALLSTLKRGIRLMTLAPEITPPGLLDRFATAGVVLAAGHTNATYAEIETARRHGLRGFTHLFNAMSQLTAREPGAVGAALSDEDSYCGLIVDGKHVDPMVLKLALKVKRHDRFMLVTDAMSPVGTDVRSFTLQGRTIRVEDSYCIDEHGTLAGTALDMSRAVRNAIALLGLSTEEAVRMASEYPADFLGLSGSHGRLARGCRADLVIADDDLLVSETWIGGVRVYGSPRHDAR
jgi:N-acetylglucosamine-6-phosphate deacetylase